MAMKMIEMFRIADILSYLIRLLTPRPDIALTALAEIPRNGHVSKGLGINDNRDLEGNFVDQESDRYI